MAQVIHNTDYGTLRFSAIFYGQSVRENGVSVARGGQMGILEGTGAYVHFPSGKPVRSQEEGIRILTEVYPDGIDDFIDWWERRDERAEAAAHPPPRAIQICPDGILRFLDDHSEVLLVTAVYEYFPPDSPVLETALRCFTEATYNREEAARSMLLDKDAERYPHMDKAFGRNVEQMPPPGSHPAQTSTETQEGLKVSTMTIPANPADPELQQQVQAERQQALNRVTEQRRRSSPESKAAQAADSGSGGE